MFEGLRIAKMEPVKLRLKVGAEPVTKKGRPLSQEQAKIMKVLSDNLLNKKVLRRSNSPWCSPAFLVGKPGIGIGSDEDIHKRWRKVLDYTCLMS